jgi:hypothetical protein
MKNSKTCPKCHSSGIIRIPGWSGAYGSGHYIPTGTAGLSSVKITGYMCDTCGYLENWIDSLEDIEKIRATYIGIGEDMRDPTECLSCSAVIPSGSYTCPECGWSYKEASSDLH